jgi:hypothetical protein
MPSVIEPNGQQIRNSRPPSLQMEYHLKSVVHYRKFAISNGGVPTQFEVNLTWCTKKSVCTKLMMPGRFETADLIELSNRITAHGIQRSYMRPGIGYQINTQVTPELLDQRYHNLSALWMVAVLTSLIIICNRKY